MNKIILILLLLLILIINVLIYKIEKKGGFSIFDIHIKGQKNKYACVKKYKTKNKNEYKKYDITGIIKKNKKGYYDFIETDNDDPELYCNNMDEKNIYIKRKGFITNIKSMISKIFDNYMILKYFKYQYNRIKIYINIIPKEEDIKYIDETNKKFNKYVKEKDILILKLIRIYKLKELLVKKISIKEIKLIKYIYKLLTNKKIHYILSWLSFVINWSIKYIYKYAYNLASYTDDIKNIVNEKLDQNTIGKNENVENIKTKSIEILKEHYIKQFKNENINLQYESSDSYWKKIMMRLMATSLYKKKLDNIKLITRINEYAKISRIILIMSYIYITFMLIKEYIFYIYIIEEYNDKIKLYEKQINELKKEYVFKTMIKINKIEEIFKKLKDDIKEFNDIKKFNYMNMAISATANIITTQLTTYTNFEIGNPIFDISDIEMIKKLILLTYKIDNNIMNIEHELNNIKIDFINN